MRQNSYRKGERGAPFVYAMILDTFYCYREVWRVEIGVGNSGRGHRDGLERAVRVVNEVAVERLAELEAEHEEWVAAT